MASSLRAFLALLASHALGRLPALGGSPRARCALDTARPRWLRRVHAARAVRDEGIFRLPLPRSSAASSRSGCKTVRLSGGDVCYKLEEPAAGHPLRGGSRRWSSSSTGLLGRTPTLSPCLGLSSTNTIAGSSATTIMAAVTAHGIRIRVTLKRTLRRSSPSSLPRLTNRASPLILSDTRWAAVLQRILRRLILA